MRGAEQERRNGMKRRDFVKLAVGTALASKSGTLWAAPPAASRRLKVAFKLEPFDYRGVRLLPGPFADRLAATRAFYLSVPDDDIVKGFREKAGLPAPGTHLGGWCDKSSALLFGQWLSGMARIYRATGDAELRDKAVRLMTAWGETLPKQTFGHYDYDKFVCGLVDMAEYADCPAALPLLARMTDWAEANLGRARLNASDEDSQGGYFNGQMEWYTLPENLYRAYLLTGDARYKAFGDVWRYPYYWGMFNGKTPGTPDGFHGYSHANALSSAAMTYAVTGDSDSLKTIANAYDYFQKTQCYATGGYGPGEKLMRPDGELGRSIVSEPNAKFLSGSHGRSFETPCGTWAVFKLGRYLQQFTGAARYGGWTERVLYNGIGAALPMRGRGGTFYYADYRLQGAGKHYYGAPFPCCAGTYIQDVADLHNILYFQNAGGLFVSQYVPSEVAWKHGGQDVTLTQTTRYPEAEDIHFALTMARPATFTLGLRVPEWAQNVRVSVNGRAQTVAAQPGEWLTLHRAWENSDRVSLHIPLAVRDVPIDAQHPGRICSVRGPVVLVRPEGGTGLVPFSQVGEGGRYAMYFDPPTVTLVPTSQQAGAVWRWTTGKPGRDWNTTAFDASAWREGAAPFGTMDVARTKWDTPDIWIRREVTLPAGEIAGPQLLMFYDEDAEVFLNGVPAARMTGYSTAYEQIELTPAAKAQIRPGAKLLIAVHVHQATGSQLIDLGLVDVAVRGRDATAA